MFFLFNIKLIIKKNNVLLYYFSFFDVAGNTFLLTFILYHFVFKFTIFVNIVKKYRCLYLATLALPDIENNKYIDS